MPLDDKKRAHLEATAKRAMRTFKRVRDDIRGLDQTEEDALYRDAELWRARQAVMEEAGKPIADLLNRLIDACAAVASEMYRGGDVEDLRYAQEQRWLARDLILEAFAALLPPTADDGTTP